ncbi:hypothetical protein NH8B_2118 [Pseudogulbenkiania sp. NH8B]|uniref:hypothetical protein n=1 Tax=Pseudogulbenkiania sp. (strain NH8B) TaxID=748280 RepID=UPI0002279BBA|nr:hypothetical protein [Pseudogulbenkiania sp. NH8B]BAK76504.1 hypothetical protein NH8B_1687 [Pseudogulbenkiania sp. NH8B]BAK76933.1 hypothetical protein NH8B_2118 [Pseudogulbenkiania sp. NH8B]
MLGTGILSRFVLGQSETTRPDNTFRLPLHVVVTAPAAGSMTAVAVRVAVVPARLDASTWSIRVMLGGADVSERLTGSVEIEAEEGAARIATLTLLLAAGDTLAGYAGAVLAVDAQATPAAPWVRRFTGRVVVPELDLEQGTVRLHGQDARREVLALADRSAIDAMLGGHGSDVVFGAGRDSLRYATDQLITLAAAFDLDIYGNPRLTPWSGLAITRTLSDDDLIDGTLHVQPAALTDVVNVVTNDTVSLVDDNASANNDPRNAVTVGRQRRQTACSFEYRLPRLHQWTFTYHWNMGISYSEYVIGNNGKPYQLPEKTLFEQAAQNTGWLLASATYHPPRPTGFVGYSSTGSVLIFVNDYTGDPATDPRCDEAQLTLVKRIAQVVTERWRLTVCAPDSVVALGTRKQQGATASLDANSRFQSSEWEGSSDVAPLIAGTTDVDTLPGVSRATCTTAIKTLAALGRAQILASHRATRVRCQIPADLRADLNQAWRLDSRSLLASGKLARLVERYDLNAGTALMDVELAVSALIGAGTVDASPLPDPALSAITDQSLTASVTVPSYLEGRAEAESGTGFTTGAQGDTTASYPRQVVIQTPAIPATLTDPLDVEQTYDVTVAIPVDEFTVRIPTP